MEFLTRMLSWLLRKPRHRLEVRHKVWAQGIAELRARAGGVRESGAFLLGRHKGGCAHIERFVYYDDLDPHCLRNGAINFNGACLGDLWAICRTNRLEVVADVHLHPGGYGQSSIDQANPMIPSSGHLALIIPDFAMRGTEPGHIGIYEYKGGTAWLDHSRRGQNIMKVTK